MKQPTPLPTDFSFVRLAGAEDEGDLLSLLKEAHKEAGPRTRTNEPLPFSEPKVVTAIREATRRNPSDPEGSLAWAGIIGPPGGIAGSLCVTVSAPWFSESSCLHEKWFFVHREFRRSNASRLLLSFAKAISDTLIQYDPLLLGVNSTERTEAKMRLYEKLPGCTLIGGMYQYNPQYTGASDSAGG